MGTLNLIRALMYLEKSVPVKEKGRERQKKRDRDTERARDGPKKSANYGPSPPVSIPTPCASLAQMRLAQWRRTRRSSGAGSGGAWSGAWGRRADTSKKSKVERSLAHIFFYMRRAQIPLVLA